MIPDKQKQEKNKQQKRQFQWETFLDRIFAFGASEGKCALARVATAKCSQIPYWSAPSPAILLTKFGLFACYRDLGLYAGSDGQQTDPAVGFADANFAHVSDEQRKSISGYCFFMFYCMIC